MPRILHFASGVTPTGVRIINDPFDGTRAPLGTYTYPYDTSSFGEIEVTGTSMRMQIYDELDGNFSNQTIRRNYAFEPDVRDFTIQCRVTWDKWERLPGTSSETNEATAGLFAGYNNLSNLLAGVGIAFRAQMLYDEYDIIYGPVFSVFTAVYAPNLDGYWSIGLLPLTTITTLSLSGTALDLRIARTGGNSYTTSYKEPGDLLWTTHSTFTNSNTIQYAPLTIYAPVDEFDVQATFENLQSTIDPTGDELPEDNGVGSFHYGYT